MAWIQVLASAVVCCQETALCPSGVVAGAMVALIAGQARLRYWDGQRWTEHVAA